ncbi:hypothetical protein RCH16_001298 [Cryobacterium sp. MP_M5]|uniref:zinc ribbon domain-containing protein n=1 Tax=unclassified Cryobacterium TaxID=2649013 RepID=UPI0018CAB8C9|nr:MULTISPECIES: zinc ribbon domain-containing protein [unclassified Cryobacterium]MBG6056624.1 hypothetical protein [Cryobacterium sp. MP_M3]MEC5176296.1 hypothetical protein [Cryobacterium sp. MP_M5]
MSGTGTPGSFAQFAGRVLWPRRPADLTDVTQCPACQSRLRSVRCPSCGLDLSHPAATELLAASTDAAALLDKRVALIGRIRFDLEQARAAQAPLPRGPVAPAAGAAAVATPTAAAPESSTTPAAAPVFAVPAVAALPAQPLLPVGSQLAPPPRAEPHAAGAPRPPKRSSVQILLLLVGVTLVSVAAIFFLTVAWLFAGLAVRSLIVGLVTVAALVTAAFLRRRTLVATAEGIGALAVVLVLLDAWALRQNDLFGLAGTDALAYWGVTLVACTVLFLGWHAVSRLRVASVAGFAAAAPGLGLLTAGLATGQPDATRLYLAFLGASIGALVHRFTLPAPGDAPVAAARVAAAPVADAPIADPAAAPAVRGGRWPSIDRVPERVTVLALGGLALAGASLAAAFVDPDNALAPVLTLGVVAAVALLHTVVVLVAAAAGGLHRTFAYGTAALATLAVVAIAPLATFRADDLALATAAPILISVGLALALEFLARRSAGPTRTAAIVSALTAAFAAANFALLVGLYAAIPLAGAVAGGLSGAGDPLAPLVSENVWALGALAGVGLLTTLAWALGGLLQARARVIAWLFAVVAVLAVPFLGALWLVALVYVLLGVLSLLGLLVERFGRASFGPFRPIMVAFLASTMLFGYLVSWNSSGSWWVGSAGAILALFTARLLVDRMKGASARGALLAGALLLTLVAAVAAPWALNLGAAPIGDARLVDQLRGLTLVTALLQLLVAVPLPLFGATERRWAFWTLLVPTAAAFALPLPAIAEGLTPAEHAALLQAEPAAGIAHAALLLATPLVWVLAGRNRELHRERLTAAGALAPVLLLLGWSVIRATDAPAAVATLALPAAAAALLVFALALFLGTRGGLTAGSAATAGTGATAGTADRDRDRLALEAGAALVLVPAAAWAVSADLDVGWLVLLVAGVAALVAAIAADGLFASRSPRRHLGWLAMGLGIAGLWRGLSAAGTDALEPFVLPVAGLLLVVAVLVRRFGRVDRVAAASPVAALLTLAGLLVAVLPLAVAGQTGPVARPIVVMLVCALLALAAAGIRWSPARSAYLAAAGAAGTAGLAVAVVARAVTVLNEPGLPDGRLELWLLPLVVVAAAAFLLPRHPDARTRSVRRLAGTLLLAGVLTIVSLAEIAGFDGAGGQADGGAGTLRGTALVLGLGALHLLALTRDGTRGPLRAETGWVAVALAVLVAFAAVVTGAVDPFELVTVPLGLFVVAGQLLPRLRAGGPAFDALATRRFGAGLAIGLLPSAFTDGDTVLRPILTLAVGGALAVAAAVLTPHPRWRAPAGLALMLGLVTVVSAAGGRIVRLLAEAPAGPDARLEAWLLPAALALVVAGTILVTGAHRAAVTLPAGTVPTGAGRPTDAAALRLGYALVILATALVLAAELPALDFAPLATIRVILLVWTFSSLHLAAFWFDESPLGRGVSWVFIAAGAVAVLAGFAHAAPDTIEIVSVPLAVALLTTGWLHLEATPAARSWSWFAPGLLVLLVPSLLLDVTESPLWRVVGLGVVATVVIVVGAVRRLQAPFVIGAVVLLVHAIAQLWPWISLAYGAVPWWLWLGIGGTVLIVLAARYEQRIGNLKAIALGISALR